MKVFVAVYDEVCSEHTVKGVFTTLEAAKAALLEGHDDPLSAEWHDGTDLMGTPMHSAELDHSGSPCARIYEMDVR